MSHQESLEAAPAPSDSGAGNAPSTQRRWPRRLALALSLILLILLLTVLLAPRSSTVRRAVLDRVSQEVADRADLDLRIVDFELDLIGRRLEVEGIALAAPDQPPFLTIDRATVAWERWRDLLVAPRRLQQVVVEAPHLDLDAPLPQGQGTASEPSGTNASLGLDVERWVVTDLRVAQSLPDDRGWLGRWSLEPATVEGTLLDDRLVGTLTAPRLVLEPRDDPAIALTVDSRIEGGLTGPYTLDSLRVAGDGLSLEASARVDPRSSGGLSSTLELEAEPARWLPSLAAEAGIVHLAGDVELPFAAEPFLTGLRGRIDARAERFPPEILEPLLGSEWIDTLSARDSELEVVVDLELDDPPVAAGAPSSAGPQVLGNARIGWSRGDEVWFDGALKVAEDAYPALRLDLDGALLPALQGERSLSGSLELPRWPEVDGARLDPVSLAVTGDDLGSLLADVAERWPAIEDALPAPLGELTPVLAGRFDLAASARGVAENPETETRFVWYPTGSGSDEVVDLTFEGRPVAGDGEGSAMVTGLDLARLAAFLGPTDPGVEPLRPTGRVSIEGELALVGGSPEGTLRLDLAEAGLGIAYPGVEDGRIDVRLTPPTAATEASWLSVAGDLRLTDEGVLRWASEAPFATPLERLTLELDGQNPLPGIDAVDARLELDNGVLRIDSAHLTTAVEPSGEATPGTLALEARGTLPLATLGVVPELADSLAGLPLRTRGGPVELEVTAAIHDLVVPLTSAADTPEGVAETAAASETADTLETGATTRETPPALGVEGSWQVALSWLPGRLGESRMQLTTERLELTPRGDTAPPGVFDLGGPDGLAATLENGVLQLGVRDLRGPRGRAAVDLKLPLGSLLEAPGVGETLGELGQSLLASGPTGPWALEAEVDLADLGAVADWLAPSPVRELCGQLGLAAQLDPARPLDTRLEALVDGVSAQVGGRQLVSSRPLRVDLVDRRLVIDAGLDLGGEDFDVVGEGRLALGESGTPTLRDLELHGRGHIPADLVDPWLPDGVGRGRFAVDLRAEGDLDALAVRAELDGTEGSIVLTQPYRTVVREPKVRLHNEGERWILDALDAEVNEGELAASGEVDAEGLTLTGIFDSLRYQVDFGLNTLTSGNFEIFWPLAPATSEDTATSGAENGTETAAAESADRDDEESTTPPPRIAANVLVERAVLRRDVPLVRQVLEALFGPGEVPGLAEPPADDPRLDLSIATVDGLRVRNNLADLRATWNPLTIRGTASQPVISGGVDVESGGLISLYGQVLRLDRAQLTFSGLAGVAPELDLQTTSTLEDPTVGRGRSDLFDDGGSSRESADVDRALTTGLAGFAGERLSDLASPLLGGRTSISVQPVLIFGESDPDARLAVRRDLSSTLALVLAINLRDTQRRTYLVDLHALPILPRFQAQVFTDESDEAGATIQQTYEFGGGPTALEGQRRLRNLVLDVPPGFETKPLVRATRLRSGALLDDGADFDVEIDVAEALRRQGHPAATVRTDVRPAGDGRVDLLVRVDPGPRAEVELTGDLPPRALRRSIRDLYDPVLDRATLRTELRGRTREVFRGLGHPAPKVSVRFEDGAPDPTTGEPTQRVVIHTRAGKRRPLTAPRFEGLPEEVAETLTDLVSTQLERLELAEGSETADRRLLAHLRNLGYPRSQVVARRLENDERPVVEIAPGPRRRIASLAIEGLPEGAEKLSEDLPIATGDALRTDLFARAVVDLEGGLRELGWADAKVRPVVSRRAPSEDGQTLSFDLELRVEPGRRRELGTLHVRGESATRPGWIRRLAQLDEGQTLPPREITDARRRLLTTGLFSRVQVLTEAVDDRLTDVYLEVEEVPRFRIAGGLRWTTDDGLSTVLDVLDRNFTGRASSIGLRLRYGDDDQAMRLYSVVPRIFASRNDLELFAEVADDSIGQRVEVSAQVSRRIGRDLLARVYGRYRRVEDAVVADDGSLDDADIPFLGFQLARGRQQPSEVITRGTFWSLDLSGSSPELGSPQRFARLFAQLHHHRAVPWGRRWTWSQSLRVGIADAFGEPLLRDLRFFTGGPLSVRGYDDDTLGPQMAVEGGFEAEGGEALLVMNQELRFPVWSALSGVVFVDAGNVWTTIDELDTDLAWSAGFGIRYTSPIGLLRLDAGFPIDRRDGDDSFEIGLGFGHAF